MAVESGAVSRWTMEACFWRASARVGAGRVPVGAGPPCPPPGMVRGIGLGYPLAYPDPVEVRRELAHNGIVLSPGVPLACEAELRERYEDHAIDGVERG